MALRRPAILAFALVPVFAVGIANAGNSAPPPKFPVTAEVFHKWIDGWVGQIREACNAHCKSAKQRSTLDSAIAQVQVRTQEVCRDGKVTDTEADYVMAPLDGASPDDDDD